MQSNKTESLQDLAKNAKKRMKQGYWSDIIESRKKDMDIASKNGVDKSEVLQQFR